MGGSVPRETNIQGQRHSLAYINPFEEDLLQKYRGDMPTVPGPGGVPSYYYGQGMQTTSKEFQEGKTGTGKSSTFASSKPQKQNPNRDDNRREREQEANRQAAASMIAAQQAAAALEREDNIAPAATPVTPSAVNIFGDTNPNIGTGYTAPPQVSVVTGETATSPLAVETSVRPRVRPDDLKGERDGIMGVVDKIGSGFKTILSDIQMGITANPFGSPDQQRKNLRDAGYSDFEIDEYFLATAETQERMKNQTNAPRGDDDNTMAAVAVAADPCPEGYKLDPITQQCVIDDTIDVLNPGGQQVTDFVMPSVNPVIGQAANYTGAVAPTYTPNPLQPYAPGVAGNLLQASAPGLARTPAMRNGGSVGGIMGLPR